MGVSFAGSVCRYNSYLIDHIIDTRYVFGGSIMNLSLNYIWSFFLDCLSGISIWIQFLEFLHGGWLLRPSLEAVFRSPIWKVYQVDLLVSSVWRLHLISVYSFFKWKIFFYRGSELCQYLEDPCEASNSRVCLDALHGEHLEPIYGVLFPVSVRKLHYMQSLSGDYPGTQPRSCTRTFSAKAWSGNCKYRVSLWSFYLKDLYGGCI